MCDLQRLYRIGSISALNFCGCKIGLVLLPQCPRPMPQVLYSTTATQAPLGGNGNCEFSLQFYVQLSDVRETLFISIALTGCLRLQTKGMQNSIGLCIAPITRAYVPITQRAKLLKPSSVEIKGRNISAFTYFVGNESRSTRMSDTCTQLLGSDV